LAGEWLEATRDRSNFLRLLDLPDAVTVLAAASALDPARTTIETFAPRFAFEHHALLTARAIVAEAVGDTDEGARLYAEAAEGWRQFGNVVDKGRCLLGAGRCLVERARASEAAPRLHEAREVFAGLGARPLLAQTDQLLARLTALTS